MNQINVTVELCAEDRARLDNILIALQAKTETVLTTDSTPCAPVSAKEEPKQAEPVNTTPAPEKAQETPKTEPTQPDITLEQIQQKVVQLAAAGAEQKTKVREIISRYGNKVSDLKDQPDKLPEVWAQLTALG